MIEQFVQEASKFSPELDTEDKTGNYKEIKPTSFVDEINKNMTSENNYTPFKFNPTENLLISPDKKRNFQSLNQANLNRLKEVL